MECYSGVRLELESAKEITSGKGLSDGDESVEGADK